MLITLKRIQKSTYQTQKTIITKNRYEFNRENKFIKEKSQIKYDF